MFDTYRDSNQSNHNKQLANAIDIALDCSYAENNLIDDQNVDLNEYIRNVGKGMIEGAIWLHQKRLAAIATNDNRRFDYVGFVQEITDNAELICDVKEVVKDLPMGGL